VLFASEKHVTRTSKTPYNRRAVNGRWEIKKEKGGGPVQQDRREIQGKESDERGIHMSINLLFISVFDL
jgi:hypothetical protein